MKSFLSLLTALLVVALLAAAGISGIGKLLTQRHKTEMCLQRCPAKPAWP